MRASRSREQDGRAKHVLRKHTTIGFHDSHRIAIDTLTTSIGEMKQEWQKDRRGIYELLARLTRSQADFYLRPRPLGRSAVSRFMRCAGIEIICRIAS